MRNSEHGQAMEPQSSYEELHQETGLPMSDVRIGVLDLVGAGLLEKQEFIGDDENISPKTDLFSTFDAEFMPWNPEQDAKDLGVHLFNLEQESADAAEVAQTLGWEARRFNAAANWLVSARVVKPIDYMGDDNFSPCGFMIGDELLRFVRSI